MALKYSNGIYPFSLPFARYICLLGSSSGITKLEVHEEATRGLHPFVRSADGTVGSKNDIIPATALPKFKDMVKYVIEHRPGDQYIQDSRTPVIKGYPAEVYSEVLRFLRMILILEANPSTILIDEYVESKVENSIAEDPIARDNVKAQLANWWKNNDTDNSMMDDDEHQSVEMWLKILENALDPSLKGNLYIHVYVSVCLCVFMCMVLFYFLNLIF